MLVKRVQRPRKPACLLHPRFWPKPLSTISIGSTERWPDVVISSGRGSVAATLAIRRAANPRTFNIHIQSPYVHPSSFDVVVIPQHNSLRGSNVLVTKTALHRVTEVRLVEAAKKFSGRLSHLPRPLIAVLVGGSNKAEQCSPTVIKRLGELLLSAARQSGGSLAVTTSRRTGRENEDVLREHLKPVPLFFWNGADENPYFGLLALADAIVVTSNSVSMVSEASATGKPVHVFTLGDSNKKLHKFHEFTSGGRSDEVLQGPTRAVVVRPTARNAESCRNCMGTNKSKSTGVVPRTTSDQWARRCSKTKDCQMPQRRRDCLGHACRNEWA